MRTPLKHLAIIKRPVDLSVGNIEVPERTYVKLDIKDFLLNALPEYSGEEYELSPVGLYKEQSGKLSDYDKTENLRLGNLFEYDSDSGEIYGISPEAGLKLDALFGVYNVFTGSMVKHIKLVIETKEQLINLPLTFPDHLNADILESNKEEFIPFSWELYTDPPSFEISNGSLDQFETKDSLTFFSAFTNTANRSSTVSSNPSEAAWLVDTSVVDDTFIDDPYNTLFNDRFPCITGKYKKDIGAVSYVQYLTKSNNYSLSSDFTVTISCKVEDLGTSADILPLINDKENGLVLAYKSLSETEGQISLNIIDGMETSQTVFDIDTSSIIGFDPLEWNSYAIVKKGPVLILFINETYIQSSEDLSEYLPVTGEKLGYVLGNLYTDDTVTYGNGALYTSFLCLGFAAILDFFGGEPRLNVKASGVRPIYNNVPSVSLVKGFLVPKEEILIEIVSRHYALDPVSEILPNVLFIDPEEDHLIIDPNVIIKDVYHDIDYIDLLNPNTGLISNGIPIHISDYVRGLPIQQLDKREYVRWEALPDLGNFVGKPYNSVFINTTLHTTVSQDSHGAGTPRAFNYIHPTARYGGSGWKNYVVEDKAKFGTNYTVGGLAYTPEAEHTLFRKNGVFVLNFYYSGGNTAFFTMKKKGNQHHGVMWYAGIDKITIRNAVNTEGGITFFNIIWPNGTMLINGWNTLMMVYQNVNTFPVAVLNGVVKKTNTAFFHNINDYTFGYVSYRNDYLLGKGTMNIWSTGSSYWNWNHADASISTLMTVEDKSFTDHVFALPDGASIVEPFYTKPWNQKTLNLFPYIDSNGYLNRQSDSQIFLRYPAALTHDYPIEATMYLEGETPSETYTPLSDHGTYSTWGLPEGFSGFSDGTYYIRLRYFDERAERYVYKETEQIVRYN